MATVYPAQKDSFTNPSGTQTLNSPSHSTQHTNANTAISAIEDVLGTTAGTSVLKNFAAGDFPSRINSGGTLQQSVAGTVNALVLQVNAVDAGGTWAPWTPSYSASNNMTFTNVTTNYARYKQIGKNYHYQISADGTVGGTVSFGLRFSPPATPIASLYGTNWTNCGVANTHGPAGAFVNCPGSAAFEVIQVTGANWGTGAQGFSAEGIFEGL